MSDNIPEWLRPYIKLNSYTPTKEDIKNLEPQSRREMLLKYAALNSSSGEDTDVYFTTADDEDFVDSEDNYFTVAN